MTLPKWERPPKTLAQAIHRLEVARQYIYWLEQDREGSQRSWERERAEVRHLEGVLKQRWDRNDARYAVRDGCGVEGCTVIGCADTALSASSVKENET